jgi:hypothetical protein
MLSRLWLDRRGRKSCSGPEIYGHYPAGIGKSKLKIHGAEGGTARNMNTVAKLVEMASKA